MANKLAEKLDFSVCIDAIRNAKAINYAVTAIYKNVKATPTNKIIVVIK